ncbi:MAG: Ig-like domain-containing protein [Gemmatimonadaceae bacterium]|nr:Ig-like domain-containing protein [Gemmatimonadaceae bacterium]
MKQTQRPEPRFTQSVTVAREARRVLGAILVVVTGCEGRCNDGKIFELEPDIYLSSTEVRIVQGQSGNSTIGVARTGGFNGPVSFRVIESPPGLTVTFSTTTIPTGVNVAEASVRAASTITPTTPGDELRVRIEGSGTDVRDTVAFRVSVIASAVPGFTLEATPPVVGMPNSGSATTVIRATRAGGYTGPITFLVGGKSDGFDVTLQPGPGADATTATIKSFGGHSTILRYSAQIAATAPGIEFNPSANSVEVAVRIVEPLGFDLGFANSRTFSESFRLPRGTRDTATIALNRRGGFGGPVTFTLENVPSQLTVELSPTTTTGNGTFLTVRVADDAQAFDRLSFLIRGRTPSEFGLPDATLEVSVFVDRTPFIGTFTLSAPNVSLLAGQSTTSLLTIGRVDNFNSPIELSVGPSPDLHAGPTVTTTPLVTSGNGLLNIVSTQQTPPGVYGYNVFGRVGGELVRFVPFTVTVVAPPRPTTMSVPKIVNGIPILTPAESVPIGSTVNLNAFVQDQNSQPIVNAPVTWTSSNAFVATVSPSGEVRGLALGTTTIAVQPGDNPTISATVNVTVVPPSTPVADMVLDPLELSVPAGTIVQYQARLLDANGRETSPAPGFRVTYVAATSAIAEVTNGDNTTGRITAKTGGFTQVIAYYGPSGGGTPLYSATANLSVGNTTAGSVAAVRITNDHLLASAGVSFGWTAVALDASGNTLTGVTFRWSSSNASSTSINATTGVSSSNVVGGARLFAAAILPNGNDGPRGVAASTVRPAGAVQGTVNVQSGPGVAPAVGATLRAFSGGTLVGAGVVTSAGATPGRAYIPGLIAGTYTVMVSLPGYATRIFTGVVVTSGSVTPLNGTTPIVLVPNP